MSEEPDVKKELEERFNKLPKVVQDAITSAGVSKNLQKLADMHKLHVDQWETLENEVQLTLMGIQPSEELEENIRKEVHVPDDVAHELTVDIMRTVFEPIRQELERGLSNPNAVPKSEDGIETQRREALASEAASSAHESSPQAPLPQAPQQAAPAAAPAPAPAVAKRAPVEPTYLTRTPSSERPSIDGDPYREQLK